MSLDRCIKSFGKAIDAKDTAALKQSYDSMVAKGMSEDEAQIAAIKELQSASDSEIDDILSQVEQAGGKVQRAEAVERKPMPIAIEEDGEVKIIDANQRIDEIDDTMTALNDIVACAYK